MEYLFPFVQLGEFYAAFVLEEIKNLLAVPQTHIKGKLTNISNWKVEKALVKKSFFVEIKVNEVVMEANKAVIYLWLGSLLEWIGADPATPAETIIIKKRYQPALQLKCLHFLMVFIILSQSEYYSIFKKQSNLFFFSKDVYFSV